MWNAAMCLYEAGRGEGFGFGVGGSEGLTEFFNVWKHA